MTVYEVTHRSAFRYLREMADGYTVARLVPRHTKWQRVVSATVDVAPSPDERDEYDDAFGNRVVRLGVHHPHASLDVVSSSTVEVDERVAPEADVSWESARDEIEALSGPMVLDVGPFVAPSRFVDIAAHRDGLRAVSAPVFRPGASLVATVRDLCHEIASTFDYDPSFTDVSTPLDQVLVARRGVCQDFAHVMIGCLRLAGLAARYVSGYIETDAPGGDEALRRADASHAWCSVWIPDAGWLDVDPTNDQVPVTRHVTVGWGRDYADVAPVRGVVIGPPADQLLDVDVRVRRR